MLAAEYQQTRDLIQQADRLAVVTHIAPDGDAIGSLLALGRVLKAVGKDSVTLACDDRVPPKLTFLPGAGGVVSSVEGEFDLVITVDCSDRRRGGKVLIAAAGDDTPIVNIDHHVTNTHFGRVSIVEPDATSTTEVLYRLFQVWGQKIDEQTAVCLLTGLVTDTLCFRTANVTPAVMSLASVLMEAGADLADITGHTVNRRAFGAIRYWGELLQSVELVGRVVSVHATRQQRQEIGFNGGGDASIASLLSTTWEADMAVSFVEADDGRVEISFRAKPGFDVSVVALELGGGGHPSAAGCTVEAPLHEVRKQVLMMLHQALLEQKKQPHPSN